MIPAALLALSISSFISIPEENPLAGVLAALGKGRDGRAMEIAEGFRAEVEREGSRDPHDAVYSLSLFFHIELSRGRVDKAGAIARKALGVARARGGEGSVAESMAYELVATAAARRKDATTAKEAALKSLAILEATGEGSSDQRANTLNLLASISLADDPEAAERYAREAVAIGERSLVSGAPSLSSGLILLAIACADRSHGEEAEALAVRAVNLAEEGWGRDDCRLLDLYIQAAHIKCRRRKLPEGESFLNRAALLAISKGKQCRASLVEIYQGLSKIQFAQRCLCDAERAGREALRLHGGEERPKLAEILDNLAAILNAAGKPEEAYPLLKRANAIRAKALVARGRNY